MVSVNSNKETNKRFIVTERYTVEAAKGNNVGKW
jgi:hypothetical protein